MSLAEQFPEITKRNQPLAPFTHLKIGGPAEFLVQPRTLDELNAVLTACQRDKIPVRMLGGGFNLLIQDDPIPGAVIRLTAAPFTFLQRDGKRIIAGGGGQLFDLIAFAVKHGSAGSKRSSAFAAPSAVACAATSATAAARSARPCSA